MQGAEQLRYAKLVERCTWLGMALLVLTFLAYAVNLLPGEITPAQWPALWDKPVGDYIQLTGTPTGWGWLYKLHRGDFASLSGVAVLAGCSMLSVLSLIPIYLKERDRAYALIAVLQTFVLLLAASGMLRAVH
jgi:hypothetical protein